MRLKSILSGLLSVGLVVVAAPASAGETEEANKALARRFYERAWFAHNLDAVDELVAPNYVVHDTAIAKASRSRSRSRRTSRISSGRPAG